MGDQARAILWAQWRTLLNFYSRGNLGSLVFTVIMGAIWYGMATAGAVGAAFLSSDPTRLAWLEKIAPTTLVFLFLYWQVVPILLASAGTGLDLRRLVVYPVTHRQLFALEVLLRFSTGVEVTLILIGVSMGLWFNPAVRWWGPLAFLPWMAFNLTLSAGLRDLLGRLLARRGMREIAVLVVVLIAGLPQLLLVTGVPEKLRAEAARVAFDYWPWQITARVALARFAWLDVAAMAAWTALACVFGRWQFERGLRFDAEAARATPQRPQRGGGLLERLYRIPSLVFPDPLGAIFEKEVRYLSRAPRFRIVFFMGFSFGLLIWLPIAFREGRTPESFFASNYLTFVTVYALMLLGEVSFWNVFGFDRAAAQIYYVTPVRFSRVLIGKNLAALTFVLLEVSAVAAACAGLRMPLTPARLAEAYAVTLVMTLFLLAAGNLASVWYPRPSNPTHSWRSASAGKMQALLALLYPVFSIPIVLAYLARYAFDSTAAFYAVLAFGAALGAAFYGVALDSAVKAADARKERIVMALVQGEGPVSL